MIIETFNDWLTYNVNRMFRCPWYIFNALEQIATDKSIFERARSEREKNWDGPKRSIITGEMLPLELYFVKPYFKLNKSGPYWWISNNIVDLGIATKDPGLVKFFRKIKRARNAPI